MRAFPWIVLSIFSFMTACSSIHFTKENILYGTLAGSALGAGIGYFTAKKHEGAAAAIGAAAGGLAGALTVTAISKEEEASFDFLRDLKNNSKKSGSTSSYAVPVKNLPKDVQGFFKAPSVHMGKLGWTELDGELHEPHKYYYYEEGGLSAK